jgi:hypothetical protein
VRVSDPLLGRRAPSHRGSNRCSIRVRVSDPLLGVLELDPIAETRLVPTAFPYTSPGYRPEPGTALPPPRPTPPPVAPGSPPSSPGPAPPPAPAQAPVRAPAQLPRQGRTTAPLLRAA